MKNTSVMPIEYEWKFSSETKFEVQDGVEFQLNDIFDILPLNGTLNPG